MKKIILILLVAALGIAVFLYIGKVLSPGSYPYAEEYEFSVPEGTLISAIKGFRDENPQYRLPKDVGIFEGRMNDQDHWYHVYFYYPIENQIIYVWTRPSEQGKTTLALISINYGRKLGKWRDINKDFSSSENDEQKRKFEERILNPIRKKTGR